jgi:hypothetical protein
VQVSLRPHPAASASSASAPLPPTRHGCTSTSSEFPQATLLPVRSLAILEGIALASDPNYKVLVLFYPGSYRSPTTDTELRKPPRQRSTRKKAFRFDRLILINTRRLKSPPAYREQVSTQRNKPGTAIQRPLPQTSQRLPHLRATLEQTCAGTHSSRPYRRCYANQRSKALYWNSQSALHR